MPVPSPDHLLAELDRGTHRDRVRTMARLGRDHVDDPALGELLDAVAAPSAYHHHLALVAAAAAGDLERLQAARTSAAPRIRAFAFAQLVRVDLTPDAARRVLLDGSAEDRRAVQRLIAGHGRADLADAVIDDLRRELGDRAAGRLLPACSGSTVRRLLPDLLDAIPSVARLARRHPDALLDHVEVTLDQLSPRRRDLLWSRLGAGLAGLALHDPDRMLGLLERVGPTTVVPGGLEPVLGHLVRFAPGRLAALLTTDEHVATLRWRLPGWLRRNAHRFGPDDRIAIARSLRERPDLLFGFIGRLPPVDRGAVFDAALDDVDTATTTWAPHLLAVLPHDVRHREARRILELRAVRESDQLRHQYVACLPFAEARPVLEPLIRRARADDRSNGYALLLACAGRERSAPALADVLGLLDRIANEQDPVRFAVAHSLEHLSPAVIADEHLDAIGSLVDAVTEARDTSPTTLRALTTFGLRVLAEASVDPTSPRFRFAIEALDRLAGPTGVLALPRLDHMLARGAEVAVVDHLLPRLERDAALDRFELTFAVTRSLGTRARHVVGIQSLLELATVADDERTARTAIELWLDDPQQRSERAGRLVALDESALVVRAVLAAVNRSRQDLLDVLLRPTPLRGRFWARTTRFVPVLTTGFERWLPRQVEQYRGGLDTLIATEGNPDHRRAAAIRTLGRLPEIGAAALAPYLASDEVIVQEAALSSLAWTDRPGDALQELLGHAGSDRARVALYAATRCARFVPRVDLGPPLLEVLDRADAKVTARKEVARLLAQHRPPGTLDHLLALGADDRTHRDLRIAIARGLRDRLDDERVWPLLDRLSTAGDDEALALLETHPTPIAPRHRARFAALVLALAGSASRPVRTEALARLAAWSPWAPGAAAVATAAIADLSNGRDWHAALGSLRVLLRDGLAWTEVGELLAALAERDDGPQLDAGAERDRPSAQRRRGVVRVVVELPAPDRRRSRAELHLLAAQLDSPAALDPEHPRIVLAGIDWNAPDDHLAAIARYLDAHPLLAVDVLSTLAGVLQRDHAAWTQAVLEATAARVIRTDSLGGGLVALQLVQSTGERFGWPEPTRALLRALRTHRDIDIAALAARIVTATE